MTKTINRGFYIRFTNIYNYIDSKFFLEFAFSWNKKYFSGFLLLSESWADARLGQIHPNCVTDCFLQTEKEVIISDWSSKDGIKERKPWPASIFRG